jgi:hypothetical protein
MPTDLRVPMTRAEFDAIPFDPEYPIEGVYSALIDKNRLLRASFDAAGVEPRDDMTAGLRAILDLNLLDGQVCNGGITQFFWNFPETVGGVYEALELIGKTDLLASFDRAVGQVVGKREDWHGLRQRAFADPGKPDWEPFRQSYELLDLGWFDDDYYDTWSHPDDGGPGVVTRVGLGNRMLTRLNAWVRAHPDEFIRPPDGDAP